jgi:hypothetical protein
MCSMNRLDYNHLAISPASDSLKISAFTSAPSRLRVEGHTLHLQLARVRRVENSLRTHGDSSS